MNLAKKLYLFFFCFILINSFTPVNTFSQQLRYSFKNFTPSEGLPSSEVYQVLQSFDHYMWFATDHGVCRYNGYEFKTFNLPDNSILGLYEDSKKRLWAYSFSGRLFYFQNGKFENYIWNDRLVNAIKPGVINSVYIDSVETLHVSASGPIHIKISKNGVVENLIEIGQNAKFSSIQITANYFFTRIISYPVKFNKGNLKSDQGTDLNILLKHQKLNIAIPGSILPERYKLKYFSNKEIFFLTRDCLIRIFKNGNFDIQKSNYSFDDVEEIGGNYYLATGDGLKIKNKAGVILYEYFKGIHITSIEMDHEGGLWLSTLTKGVFYLNHTRIMHLAQNGRILEKKVIVLLKLMDSSLLGATESNEILKFRVNKQFERIELNMKSILSLYQDNSSVIFVGGSVGYGSEDFWKFNKIIKSKSIKFLRLPASSNIIKDGDVFYNGTPERIFEFRFNGISVSDKKLSKDLFRVSKLFLTRNHELLVGNLFGLWCYKDGRLFAYDSSKKTLSSRVTDINEYKQKYLCLGTRGKGLLFMLSDSIYEITANTGLISNNIRKIFIDNNHIWLATNSGISIITIQSETPFLFSINNISVQDGLLSNEVNDIINNGNEVIVASNAGISFINKESIFREPLYKLPFYTTEIKVNNETVIAEKLLFLDYKKRNLSVSYEALNYSNPGKNNYRYRLYGFDTTWLYTNDLNVQFNPLPYGSYQLQIQAKREFDAWSQSTNIEMPLKYTPPFWSTLWFFILSLAVVLLLSYLYFKQRVVLLKKRQYEKNEVQRKIAETEQMALKSQMNPHFIFNSLNSIQQYVIDSDVKGANMFISGFSKLIRQTLDFSSKDRIALSEEISYLTNYLDLEKMRMENKFSYEVDIHTEHSLSELEIPPLLLQPYVENALRHGVLFLEKKEGIIRLSFKEQNGILECVIEDNGIGRIRAMQLKSNNAIEYQSKGMSLTANRIELLNKTLEKPIQIIIEDLHDEQNAASGTRVKVFFRFN